MSRKYFVPTVGFAVVIGLGLLLIGVVVIKPGVGPNVSWRTHLNLVEEPVDDYTRSVQTFVSEEGSAPNSVWQRADCEGTVTKDLPAGYDGVDLPACDDDPIVEWVAHGCAGCHGLDGSGGVVGPDVQEVILDEFSDTVRFGPSGMPAFALSDLSDEHLGLIREFLEDRWVSNFPSGIPPTPTPTPEPTPVPTAVPTNTPNPVAPVTTPTPETEVNESLELGKLVFEETAGVAGCAECHGLDGAGIESAPDVRGATRSMVREALVGAFDMTDIELTNEELAAVVEYLRSLN